MLNRAKELLQMQTTVGALLVFIVMVGLYLVEFLGENMVIAVIGAIVTIIIAGIVAEEAAIRGAKVAGEAAKEAAVEGAILGAKVTAQFNEQMKLIEANRKMQPSLLAINVGLKHMFEHEVILKKEKELFEKFVEEFEPLCENILEKKEILLSLNLEHDDYVTMNQICIFARRFVLMADQLKKNLSYNTGTVYKFLLQKEYKEEAEKDQAFKDLIYKLDSINQKLFLAAIRKVSDIDISISK